MIDGSSTRAIAAKVSAVALSSFLGATFQHEKED
jgi:hypothetical protein